MVRLHRSVGRAGRGVGADGSGFLNLADDEAFLIEGEPPNAWTWNIMLYNLGWMESLDFANRLTSLNATEVHLDADGRYRLVVARHDPLVPNWIDTTGLNQAMIAYRYVRTASKPVPEGRVVKFADLPAALPAGTPLITPDVRRSQIGIRQRHVARRFRR